MFNMLKISFFRNILYIFLVIVFFGFEKNIGNTEELRFFGGLAKVIDGDTLDIDGQTIHLEGVDAPELEQQCQFNNKSILCGELAKKGLEEITNGQTIHCYERGEDPEDGILGYCRIGNKNLSMWVLYNGLGFTYELEKVILPKRRDEYRAMQQQAIDSQRNIHNYEYVLPWIWREGVRLPNEK